MLDVTQKTEKSIHSQYEWAKSDMKTQKSGQPLRDYTRTQFPSTPGNAEAHTVKNPKSDAYFPGPLSMHLKNGFTEYRDNDWYLVVRKRLETNL